MAHRYGIWPFLNVCFIQDISEAFVNFTHDGFWPIRVIYVHFEWKVILHDSQVAYISSTLEGLVLITLLAKYDILGKQEIQLYLLGRPDE